MIIEYNLHILTSFIIRGFQERPSKKPKCCDFRPETCMKRMHSILIVLLDVSPVPAVSATDGLQNPKMDRELDCAFAQTGVQASDVPEGRE